MRLLAAMALAMVCSVACSFPKGRVIPTTSAFEINFDETGDESRFYRIVRATAGDYDGISLKRDEPNWRLACNTYGDESDSRLALESALTFQQTWAVTISRGCHEQKVWISFLEVEGFAEEANLRESLTEKLLKEWPNILELPVIRGTTLPLPRDLVLTDDGYRIRSDKAENYNLEKSSPLLARMTER